MDVALIKNYLLGNKHISESKVKKYGKYKKNSYEFVIKCKVDAADKWHPIVIGIPINWKQNLVDVYWDSEEIPYIPHIDHRGKFCLYDLEGSLIEWDLLGILDQCILRARNLIFKGLNKENWEDFLKEFDSYLLCLPNCKYAKVVVPTLKKNQKISYCNINKDYLKQKKNELYAQYRKRTETKGYFVSCDFKDFKTWGYGSTIKNGIYIYVESSSIIYPPRIEESMTKEYLNNILKEIKSVSYLNKIISKHKNELFIVFEVKQLNGIVNVFGAIIRNGKFENNEVLRLIDAEDIIPIMVKRMDTQFLMNRTSFHENVLANKNYLLIGCGSIGGYVFSNLIKSGCKNITLIDSDTMKAENIYRHLLGIESVNRYKAEALRICGERTLPDLKIKTVDEKIEDAIEDCSIDFDDYDYIIAATGNSIVNRWINYYVNINEIKTPVFYIWNEPLDIGSHVAFMELDGQGCYDCLFRRDKNEELYDCTSYCKPGQKFVKNVSGCSGTFIPYGSLVSIQSSLLFMELLKKVVTGRISENIIVSEKGDDYYFKKAGLILSENFVKQNERISVIRGNEFMNASCEVCSSK